MLVACAGQPKQPPALSATRSPYLPRQRLGRRPLVLAAAAIAAGFVLPMAVAHVRTLAQPACQSMRLVVDLTDAPPDAMADVVEAAARIHTAIGIPVLVDGSTDSAATAGRVLVSWRELPSVDKRIRVVGVTRVGDPAAAVEGTITLNPSVQLRSGFDTRASWGGALLHELGHAVGLAHTSDPADLMHARQHEGPLVWGPGDEAQFATVASRWGCRSPSEPVLASDRPQAAAPQR